MYVKEIYYFIITSVFKKSVTQIAKQTTYAVKLQNDLHEQEEELTGVCIIMFLGAMYYKQQSHTALENGGHLQQHLSKESFVSDI